MISTTIADRSRLFWRLQLIGWAGTLLISGGMVLYLPIKDALVLTLFRTLFGLLATSFLLRPLLRRIRKERLFLNWTRLGLIVASCALLGIADTFFVSKTAHHYISRADMMPGTEQFLAISMLIRSVLYGCWSFLYFGIYYWLDTQQQQLRSAKAEAALHSAELKILRSQINPHFLFNALNSILAATEQPQTARKITLALADYLRFSLQQRGDTERLGVEIDALENYLQVEKSRFEENLEYRISAEPRARETIVPVALLQPLLENAIKHGQQSSIRPLKLSIQASINGEILVINVTNSGHWIEPGTHETTGIGLVNLHRRLQLIYGPSASLSHQCLEGKVTASLRLPLMIPTPPTHFTS